MTTRRLRIPRPDREVLNSLVDLPAESLDKLVRSLHSLSPTLSRPQLIECVRRALPDLEAEDAEGIITALVRSQTAREKYDYSENETATMLANSLDLADELRDSFIRRMTTLLGITQLGRVAKAIDVLTEHEHIFHSARIFTDVRPVFQADPAEPPDAAVVIHNLKIEFHDSDGQVKSMYIAMDSEDVKKFREVLNREAEKSESLNRFLSGFVPMPLLEVEDEGSSK